MIDFNRPAFVGKELSYIEDAIHRGMLCGDGEYTKSAPDGWKSVSMRGM